MALHSFSFRPRLWVCITGLLVLAASAAIPVHAQFLDDILSELNSSTCASSHCTVVGMWGISMRLHATMNMDTIARRPVAAPTCAAGSTFEVPITATGELTGMATAYFDSPPITFRDDGVVEAATAGVTIRSCQGNVPGVPCTEEGWEAGIRQAYENSGIPIYSDAGIEAMRRQFARPLEGTWSDAWQTSRPSITCQTTSASRATCRVATTTTGPVTLTLQRSVRDMVWPNELYNYIGTILDPWGLYGRGNPWPATMTSRVTIACPQQPPQPSVSPSPSIPPPPPQFPNLTITTITYDPVAPLASEGLDIAATVASNGQSGTAKATTAVARLDFQADGIYDQTLATPPVPVLGVNATHSVQWTDAGPLPAGTHRIEVCVDPQNAIAELDEQDNCRTRTIVVTDQPIFPDLIITQLTIPQTAAAHQPVTLVAWIRNREQGTAQPSVAAASLNGATIGTASVTQLLPDRQQPVSFTWTPAAAGSQALTICADATNAVAEFNEDNNCAFATITVTGGPPPTPIIPTPTVTLPPPTTEPVTTPSPQPGPIRETE